MMNLSVLALSLCLLFVPAASTQGGASPAAPSAHCGKSAGDFPVPPDPVCEAPAILNQTCLTEARNQYQEDMEDLAQLACLSHLAATQDWNQAMDVAISQYTTCIGAATTHDQKQACKAALKSASAQATKDLASALADAEAAYDAGAAALAANFGAGCCTQPGGGGTGGQ